MITADKDDNLTTIVEKIISSKDNSLAVYSMFRITHPSHTIGVDAILKMKHPKIWKTIQEVYYPTIWDKINKFFNPPPKNVSKASVSEKKSSEPVLIPDSTKDVTKPETKEFVKSKEKEGLKLKTMKNPIPSPKKDVQVGNPNQTMWGLVLIALALLFCHNLYLSSKMNNIITISKEASNNAQRAAYSASEAADNAQDAYYSASEAADYARSAKWAAFGNQCNYCP